ncbi:expressed unknown protein [Seminavis robusta]|uniref:Uncharacterized protein n=1 Tax=Seminavis robusta TaxID=568900 RepID=A0A9N8HEX2_9STRA|nr:expressed unknown protein [Seminavis robusta]|eukprot:Sro538_g162500.1 n/a (136) ;mRNA; r:9044-9527
MRRLRRRRGNGESAPSPPTDTGSPHLANSSSETSWFWAARRNRILRHSNTRILDNGPPQEVIVRKLPLDDEILTSDNQEQNDGSAAIHHHEEVVTSDENDSLAISTDDEEVGPVVSLRPRRVESISLEEWNNVYH